MNLSAPAQAALLTLCVIYSTLCPASSAPSPLNDKGVTPKQEMGMLIMEASTNPAARETLQQMARQGNSFAQMFVGGMYENGIGVKQDYEKALYWIESSANKGCPPAQYELGEIYRKGKGIPKSYENAVQWYRKSANAGMGAAQVALGRMYSHGWGVTRSIPTAMDWYTEAASYGNADASMELGVAYMSGSGKPKNELEAAKWLYLADTIGQGPAHRLLEQVEQNLTPAEIAEAQHLASSWSKSHHQEEPDFFTKCR